MNGLQIFERPEFGQVRVVPGDDGQPWFVASDVARALGYERPNDAVNTHCKKVNKFSYGDSPYPYNIIPESDVYRLIMRSKLPDAEKFETWVMEDVLPSIRAHGGYLTPAKIEEALLNPDTLIRLATDLKAERGKRLALEAKTAADRPKVLFADAVDSSSTSILVGDLAKLLRQNGVEMGQNRLFDWMRRHGLLMSHGESRNMPTQRGMEMGLFEIKERTINNPDGSIRITKTTKVTGKGQIYFVNRLAGHSMPAACAV